MHYYSKQMQSGERCTNELKVFAYVQLLPQLKRSLQIVESEDSFHETKTTST